MASRNFFAWRMLVTAEMQDDRNRLRDQRAVIRSSFDPIIHLTDSEFRNRYRLTKEAVLFLCKELERLTDLKKTQQISIEEKVSLLDYIKY